jgi:hypothetical protein
LQELLGNSEARNENYESKVGDGRISEEIQTGYFLNTKYNNTKYINTQHANTILQYVSFLEYIWAKNIF